MRRIKKNKRLNVIRGIVEYKSRKEKKNKPYKMKVKHKIIKIKNSHEQRGKRGNYLMLQKQKKTHINN